MKKLLLALCLLLCTVVLFAACGSKGSYTAMRVLTAPEKTIYTKDDSALSFSGGLIELTTEDGKTVTRSLMDYAIRRQEMTKDSIGEYIYSNVNFHQPGTYVVTIVHTPELTCSYEVQVQPTD